jgi:hypothetical protein
MHNKASGRHTRSGDDGAAVAAMAAGGLVVALIAGAVAIEALVVMMVQHPFVPFFH